jgi:hypothetical protein
MVRTELLIMVACLAGACGPDDSQPSTDGGDSWDTPRDATDGVEPDDGTPHCDPAVCDEVCRSIGEEGGSCVADECRCDVGGPDADADADGDGGGVDAPSCDPWTCDAACRSIGAPGGSCVGYECRCDTGGPDADADSSAEADADADADAEADADDGEPPTVWRPAPGTSWQWQLTDYPVDTSFDVRMYDIDLFDTPGATIDALHGEGRVVVCYFSAGSWEDWRPDAGDFPSGAIGNPLEGWEGESWLDTRDEGVRDVMRARLDLAVERGCDGVEPDNVDGYTNDPGFPLTYATQLDYNRFLAAEAHARGLSVGLKNDLDQIEDLVGDFDWALNEECFGYDECELLLPFIDAGKAVFQVEYGDASLADEICPRANDMDFDTLIKNLDLDAWRVACR